MNNRVDRVTALKKSVGPGWGSLIEQADAVASSYQARLIGCEEKFGTLYFSVSINANLEDGLQEELMEKLDQLSKQSNSVCALCGQPGQLHFLVWDYKTLCVKHLKKWHNPDLPRATRYKP